MIHESGPSEIEGTIDENVRGSTGSSEVVSPPPRPSVRQCPGCGEVGRLYRTPRGLRCMDCIRRADSGGLSFRREVRRRRLPRTS